MIKAGEGASTIVLREKADPWTLRVTFESCRQTINSTDEDHYQVGKTSFTE